MDNPSLSRVRTVATACVAIAEWAFLAWQHLHGGVPSHHFLDRADMPAISNGWGALVLPGMTWFLLGRVQRRVVLQAGASSRDATIGFLGALCFGVLLSVFFTRGDDQVTGAMFESLFLIALVVPIYRAEYLLGFVLGMAYTFGGVLPSVVGSILALVALLIHRYIRTGLLFLLRRLVGKTGRA
ncbi:hypothetical protein ATSB10_17680 [Dyella thiooxydans]|uniref:Uncharacterized protein n=1 Tax=Dyella thiooxydans TaxID=445710 RepID=A0A160N1X4_9GAMM|nr:hypothetical protein [Dyella thiooxydans]AND69222.1 hypothetical protein ATSB10_17680 [Dyella thiooxydans]